MSLWQSMKDPWIWDPPEPWDIIEEPTPIWDEVAGTVGRVFSRHAV